MKSLRTFVVASVLLFILLVAAVAQTWTPLSHQPGVNVGVMLQLRDGRVLVHEEESGNSSNWHILTPDSSGSYINGTWSSGGTLPAGYAPWFFGSQVLLDGRSVAIEGGEYNNGSGVWTTLGAIGTISEDSIAWVANSPPSGWSRIGDGASVTLADGTYMQANCCTAENALFNGPNSWTATGSVLEPNSNESGFTLLTNDLVLTVDARNNPTCGTSQGSELYDQKTGLWSCGANLPVQLYNNFEELGAAVMMYNNKVLQIGGDAVAAAVYDVASNTWSETGAPLQGLDQADGPAALEPNGNVLAMLSPGFQQTGCHFQEYVPATGTWVSALDPENCPLDTSYFGHLMVLPTGQIMFTDFSGTVEIYTPAAGVIAGVAPTINPISGSISSPSTNNVLSGTQLNGLSEANAYGDDYQVATDYPLVRLVEVDPPNSVYYATTHNEATHSIKPGTANSTQFDVPPSVPGGNFTLYAVANGIQSNGVPVTVVDVPYFSLTATPQTLSIPQGGQGNSLITVVPASGFNGSVNLNASGLPNGVTAQFSPNPTATSSTLTFTASGKAATGTFMVIIAGTAGSLTRTTTIQLTIASAPAVSLTPSSLRFAKTLVGTTSAAKNVTLLNSGSAVLNISNIGISGDFALKTSTKPCGATLAVGKSCKISVTFTPIQKGTRTGNVTITDNAANSPQQVPLTGTGK